MGHWVRQQLTPPPSAHGGSRQSSAVDPVGCCQQGCRTVTRLAGSPAYSQSRPSAVHEAALLLPPAAPSVPPLPHPVSPHLLPSNEGRRLGLSSALTPASSACAQSSRRRLSGCPLTGRSQGVPTQPIARISRWAELSSADNTRPPHSAVRPVRVLVSS